MPIVLVRVDDRLIHGQIIEGWLPCTRAQEVVVANDALAADQLKILIMQAAVPTTTRLIVDTVEKIADILMSPEIDGDVRRIVIVDSPLDALRLKRAGVPFDNLNLGNLNTAECTTHLTRSVSIGSESIKVLCNILDEGVRICIQSVPFEKPINLEDVCEFLAKT